MKYDDKVAIYKLFKKKYSQLLFSNVYIESKEIIDNTINHYSFTLIESLKTEKYVMNVVYGAYGSYFVLAYPTGRYGLLLNMEGN